MNELIIILVVVVMFRLKYTVQGNVISAWLFNFPFIVAHEMAHLVVGVVLGARPTLFDFCPTRGRDGGYMMGRVRFKNITWFSAAPIGVAPLLLIIPAFYLDRLIAPWLPAGFAGVVTLISLKALLIENALPSTQDLKCMISEPGGLMFWVVCAAAVWAALRFVW